MAAVKEDGGGSPESVRMAENTPCPIGVACQTAKTWALWLGKTVAIVALDVALQRVLGRLSSWRRC